MTIACYWRLKLCCVRRCGARTVFKSLQHRVQPELEHTACVANTTCLCMMMMMMIMMQEEMSLCMMMRSSRTEPPDLTSCVAKTTEDMIGEFNLGLKL